MGILYDLYNGKGNHFGENSINTPEYIICAAKLADLEEEIANNHPEIKELFAKYQDAQSAVTSISEYKLFAGGFRTGAQLMLEMLRPLK